MKLFSARINNSFDIVLLFFIFILAIIAEYIAPNQIGILIQIIFLILFYRSKKNYLWLAFIFIIESSPGGLFYPDESFRGFSLYNSAVTGNLYFWMPFLALSIFKTINIKVKYPRHFLSSFIILLGIYLVFLIASFGIYKWTAMLRGILPWTLLFVIPRMLKNEEDYAKFFSLIFVFVSVVLITVLYKLTTSLDFVSVFGGGGNIAITAKKNVFQETFALRPTDGILIPFLSLLGATYFLIKKGSNSFNKKYLILIIGLSVLSIFLTATRSWLISSIFIVLTFTILISKNPLKIISYYVFPTIIIAAIILTIPAFNRQAQLAFQRYETIGLLLGGDITAGGTAMRFDVRAPRVMEKFYESPLFGFGYGDEARAFSDGHVGHQNLLLHTGLVGYAIFLAMWLFFIFRMIITQKRLKNKSEYYKTPLILITFFWGIHIINISVQWFNYLISFANGLVLALLFSMANTVYWYARFEEKRLKKKLKSETDKIPYESSPALTL